MPASCFKPSQKPAPPLEFQNPPVSGNDLPILTTDHFFFHCSALRQSFPPFPPFRPPNFQLTRVIKFSPPFVVFPRASFLYVLLARPLPFFSLQTFVSHLSFLRFFFYVFGGLYVEKTISAFGWSRPAFSAQLIQCETPERHPPSFGKIYGHSLFAPSPV